MTSLSTFFQPTCPQSLNQLVHNLSINMSIFFQPIVRNLPINISTFFQSYCPCSLLHISHTLFFASHLTHSLLCFTPHTLSSLLRILQTLFLASHLAHTLSLLFSERFPLVFPDPHHFKSKIYKQKQHLSPSRHTQQDDTHKLITPHDHHFQQRCDYPHVQEPTRRSHHLAITLYGTTVVKHILKSTHNSTTTNLARQTFVVIHIT